MKYNKNNESTNKYLAGLFDGDGTIYAGIDKDGYISISFEVCGDWRVPKVDETILFLYDHYNMGHVNRRDNGMMTWHVGGDSAVSLFNRIKKHLVVKAKHGERIIELRKQYRAGRKISKSVLKRFLRWSRKNTSSLKHKKHFTWAWLAGYIDADGYIGYKQNIYTGIRFGCNYEKDKAALDLIARSTGREYRYNEKDKCIRLDIYMSKDSQATAQKYIPRLLPHLRIKKWQAEQLMRYVKEAKKPNETWKKNFKHIAPAETK